MRSSRILKHFTIYGVLLSFILIGCGEDTGQSASVEEDPIDVGLPMEDADVCPPPGVVVDQGPIGDVGVSTPAIPEFPQGESAPASGYSMVSAPLTLFDVLADGRILGATQAGITVFDGDQTLDLGETFGQLIGAHTVAGDHLVFTTEGIFALMGNELQPSPLNEVVSNIVRLIRTDPLNVVDQRAKLTPLGQWHIAVTFWMMSRSIGSPRRLRAVRRTAHYGQHKVPLYSR